MITLAAVLSRLPALDEPRLLFWVAQDWIRPARRGGELVFADIDLARMHLILDLQALDIGEQAVPVVLSLLDQLHTTRRQMQRVVEALSPDAFDRLAARSLDQGPRRATLPHPTGGPP